MTTYKCVVGFPDDPEFETAIKTGLGHECAAEKAAAEYEADCADYDHDTIVVHVTDDEGESKTVTVHCEYERTYYT